MDYCPLCIKDYGETIVTFRIVRYIVGVVKRGSTVTQVEAKQEMILVQ